MLPTLRSRLLKALIIGVTLLALGACSTVRLAYSNGPALALWWLDDWLDLDDPQQNALRPGLDRWFAWHRVNALPVYADLLAEMRAQADGKISATQVCGWTDRIRQQLWTDLDAALPAAAAWLPAIGEAQWQHLARRQAERIADLREEYLQDDPDERLNARLKRSVDRAEDLYGPLERSQLAMLAAAALDPAVDPAAWLNEREARQQALTRGLREVQRIADPVQRLAALRSTARRFWDRPAGEAGAREARFQALGCEATARLHNSATPTQREHLRHRLAGWEEDARALAARAAS